MAINNFQRSRLTFDLSSQILVDDVGKCPRGWKERSGSDTCYYISDRSDLTTWENAELFCKRNQAHMVKIDSIQERVMPYKYRYILLIARLISLGFII